MISSLDNKWEIGAALTCLDSVPERVLLLDKVIRRKEEKDTIQQQAAINQNENMLTKIKSKMIGKLFDRDYLKKKKNENANETSKFKRGSLTEHQLAKQTEELQKILLLEGMYDFLRLNEED